MESKLHKLTEVLQTSYVYLDPIPPNKHLNTLIFLHGLSDSGKGVSKLFTGEQQVVPPTCRVVLPTASKKAVSFANGRVMNCWADVYKTEKAPETLEEYWKKYNQQDLSESAELVLKMVEEEAAKFEDKDPSRVFIGGFS